MDVYDKIYLKERVESEIRLRHVLRETDEPFLREIISSESKSLSEETEFLVEGRIANFLMNRLEKMATRDIKNIQAIINLRAKKGMKSGAFDGLISSLTTFIERVNETKERGEVKAIHLLGKSVDYIMRLASMISVFLVHLSIEGVSALMKKFGFKDYSVALDGMSTSFFGNQMISQFMIKQNMNVNTNPTMMLTTALMTLNAKLTKDWLKLSALSTALTKLLIMVYGGRLRIKQAREEALKNTSETASFIKKSVMSLLKFVLSKVSRKKKKEMERRIQNNEAESRRVIQRTNREIQFDNAKKQIN